jgi:hypothetical protein
MLFASVKESSERRLARPIFRPDAEVASLKSLDRLLNQFVSIFNRRDLRSRPNLVVVLRTVFCYVLLIGMSLESKQWQALANFRHRRKVAVGSAQDELFVSAKNGLQARTCPCPYIKTIMNTKSPARAGLRRHDRSPVYARLRDHDKRTRGNNHERK